MSTFRERLQQAAYFAGVGTTQAAMANALGLNRQTINRWFLGGEPSAENLLDISKRWGVSAEWLQSGEGDMVAQPSEVLPADERELLRDYRKATPSTRQILRRMVKAGGKAVLFMVATIPPLMSPYSDAEAALKSEQLPRLCIMLNPVRLLRALQAFLTAKCHVPLLFRT